MKELLVPYGTIELAELARRSSHRDLFEPRVHARITQTRRDRVVVAVSSLVSDRHTATVFNTHRPHTHVAAHRLASSSFCE